MNTIKLPPQEYLLKLFRYDPENGNLYRRISVSDRTKVGDLVGSVSGTGYWKTSIDGVMYLVHRIIYKIHRGSDPLHIDHINGVRGNNRIENLRSVTRQENHRNTKIRIDNTSGTVGVHLNKSENKWKAQIKVNKKQIHLGTFVDLSSAVAARTAAEIKYKFHKNHGRKDNG